MRPFVPSPTLHSMHMLTVGWGIARWQVTVTLALMLLEDGTIHSLDDPVAKYIPEFSNMQVEGLLTN